VKHRQASRNKELLAGNSHCRQRTRVLQPRCVKVGSMALRNMAVPLVRAWPRDSAGAIGRVFVIHAALTTSWAPRIPAVQQHLRLDDAQFGIALAGEPLAEMAAVLLVGRFVAARGSKTSVRLLLPAFCVVAPLPGISVSQFTLFLCLAVWGALGGATNIAMNAQAVVQESASGRLLLSRLHGLWSLGGLVGAGLGTLAAAAGIPVWLQMGATGLAGLAASQAAMSGLVPGRAGSQASTSFRRDTAMRPGIVLVLLAMIYFCAQFAEGSADTWSAVFFAESSGVRAGLGGIGYAAYAVSMCCGRLAGDRIVARFGPVATVRCSALIAAVGLGSALLLPGMTSALAGLILLGMGFSTVIPLVIRASSRVPDTAGRNLGLVTSVGSVGMVCGPPLIGVAAAAATLPAALSLVVASAVVVLASAPAVRAAGGAAA
jgi:predicted MFS family arabinose efflux permease